MLISPHCSNCFNSNGVILFRIDQIYNIFKKFGHKVFKNNENGHFWPKMSICWCFWSKKKINIMFAWVALSRTQMSWKTNFSQICRFFCDFIWFLPKTRNSHTMCMYSEIIGFARLWRHSCSSIGLLVLFWNHWFRGSP